MSYKALYRRFRPNTFDEVVGQDNIVKALRNQVIKEQINHAYLFCGTRGTGKTSLAKIFAKAINCQSPINGSPCGKCAICQALNEQNSIDIIEIDAASNNRVDEIRDLREKVKYPPVNAKYKVYIIDEVHMLTESAFNALLKTLEEPPAHCVFILATTEPHKLPKTILSRCMRFDFRLIDNPTLEKLICKIYDEIKISYDLDAIKQIVKAGNGSARDTISIADTCASFVEDKLTLLDVMNILGQNSFQVLSNIVQKIIEKDAGTALTELHKIYNEGKNLAVLAQELTLYFRDLVAMEQSPELADILGIPQEYREILSAQTPKLSYQQKIYALTRFSDIETNLKYSINPLLNIEVAILKTISYIMGGDAPTQSPPSTAPSTKIELKKVWGKYLVDLSSKSKMIVYSACEDVADIYQENGNIIIEVSSTQSYNVLNQIPTKKEMQSFFEAFGVVNNIEIRKVNKTKQVKQSIADKLKELIGDTLIIEGGN